MKRLCFLFTLVIAAGCTDLDREELMSARAVEKPAKPLEVNFERLEAQKELLVELFSTEYVPLDYNFNRSPFASVVEAYRSAEAEFMLTENPIFIPKFDEFALSGILTGEVGSIAVLSVGSDSYYLKTGDAYSSSRSTILFIGADYIKIRSAGRDVFGNAKTEIKDIRIDDDTARASVS